MDTRLNIDLVLFDTSDPERTVVTLAYSSDEPAHPVWGGGVKQQVYPPDVPTSELYKQLLGKSGVEYIYWPDAPAPVLGWLTDQPGRTHNPDWRKFDRTPPEEAGLVLRAITQGTARPTAATSNQVEVEVPVEADAEPGALPAVVVFGRHDVLAPWIALEVRR